MGLSDVSGTQHFKEAPALRVVQVWDLPTPGTQLFLKFCTLGALFAYPLAPALSLDPNFYSLAIDSGRYPEGPWMPSCLGPLSEQLCLPTSVVLVLSQRRSLLPPSAMANSHQYSHFLGKQEGKISLLESFLL